MEVKDNKNEMPLRHYRTLLASLDPAAVSGRTGILFEEGCFRTKLLDREVTVSWPEGEARWTSSGGELRPNASILLLRLLTGGTLAPPTGKMLSYAELPWGETYLTQWPSPLGTPRRSSPKPAGASGAGKRRRGAA